MYLTLFSFIVIIFFQANNYSCINYSYTCVHSEGKVWSWVWHLCIRMSIIANKEDKQTCRQDFRTCYILIRLDILRSSSVLLKTMFFFFLSSNSLNLSRNTTDHPNKIPKHKTSFKKIDYRFRAPDLIKLIKR